MFNHEPFSIYLVAHSFTFLSRLLLLIFVARDKAVEGTLILKPIVHEVRIQDQVIFLDPPIEQARETWIRQLHEWLGTH